MVKSSKISGSVFVHFLLLFICISYAMVGWHFQFGKRGVVHAHFFVIFVFAWMCFQLVFNDETWVNVESSRSFEEGTIECRNVGY